MILSLALALSFSVCLPSTAEAKHRTHRKDFVLRHFLAAVYVLMCARYPGMYSAHYCARLSAEDVCVSYRRTVVCAREWIGKVEEGRFIAVISVLFRHSDSRTDRASTRFRISTSKFAVVFHTTQNL